MDFAVNGLVDRSEKLLRIDVPTWLPDTRKVHQLLVPLNSVASVGNLGKFCIAAVVLGKIQ